MRENRAQEEMTNENRKEERKGEMGTVGLGSRLSDLDSTLKFHCKFTSTPACHINLRN